MGSIAEAALTRGAKGVLFEIKSKCSLRNTKIDENVDEVLFFLKPSSERQQSATMMRKKDAEKQKKLQSLRKKTATRFWHCCKVAHHHVQREKVYFFHTCRIPGKSNKMVGR